MATKLIQKRNVVILGKTGTGKSSVANKISGHKNFKVMNSCKSVTSKVSHCEVQMENPANNIRFEFKIIDTIGLFEAGRSNRTRNQEILQEIKEYFNDKVPEGVSLVVFVFRQGRFTGEERETFDFIIKNFRSEISKISTLIITHCENEDESGRKKVIADFKRNARDIADFMEKGINAVGFPDLTNMKPKVKAAFEEDVEKDIEKLRQLVMDSGEMRLGKLLFRQSFWEKMLQCNIL